MAALSAYINFRHFRHFTFQTYGSSGFSRELGAEKRDDATDQLYVQRLW